MNPPPATPAAVKPTSSKATGERRLPPPIVERDSPATLGMPVL